MAPKLLISEAPGLLRQEEIHLLPKIPVHCVVADALRIESAVFLTAQGLPELTAELPRSQRHTADAEGRRQSREADLVFHSNEKGNRGHADSLTTTFLYFLFL